MSLFRRAKGRPWFNGVLGINARNRQYIYPNNPRPCFPFVDDKIKCKHVLAEAGLPVPRTIMEIDPMGRLDRWFDRLDGTTSFVIKPNKSFGGRGILVVKHNGESFVAEDEPVTLDEITWHIRQILSGAFSRENTEDRAYLEELVVNADGLKPFLGDDQSGVADVRLICLYDRPVMAMLRLPTELSGGKANLHQGGIGVGIDLETGLSLNGCFKGKPITHHPETGQPLAGFVVPEFQKMLEYGKVISEVVGLGYIGIDYVIDATQGVLILEVNARPGLAIQIANLTGLRGSLSA